MNILHIIPSYLPGYRASGPIVPTHLLNRSLVQKGAQVTVYTTNRDGRETLNVPCCEPVYLDGVRVRYFPASFPKRWDYSWGLHRALADTTKEFDCVHITSVFLAASTLGAYYARKFEKPYIISPHGSLRKEPLLMHKPLVKGVYLAAIERRNLAHAAAIHFTVPQEQEEYVAGGFPLTQALVIPNSFDCDSMPEATGGVAAFLKRFDIPAGAEIVLSLGRINWKKGFDTLIPAFAHFLAKRPRAILAIAGEDDGNYKKEVQRLIHAYRIVRSVVFVGRVQGTERTAVFQAARVFVLPSYSENFGMAVVEAMACGVPVVVSDRVGIAPYVSRSGAGIVTKKDEEEVARAIAEIIRDPAAARKFGERGKRLARDEFSAGKIAERFLTEYNKLISLQ
ncbi:MAG: glycosyltransferase [Candidatus Brennerbacteria bacterium]